MRTESDFLGTMPVPDEAFYGIHSLRARMNFPDQTPFHAEWYRALGLVKKACYLTAQSYFEAVIRKFFDPADERTGGQAYKRTSGQADQWTSGQEDERRGGLSLGELLTKKETLNRLIDAASEMAEGLYFEHFIVPAISGGAGTSINMNINEILANVALIKAGAQPGNYHLMDPIEDANIFQSTNDVIPTALRISVMFLLGDLEKAINELRFGVERHETAHQNDLRTGYTQMQEAVPSSFGKLFSTYSEALSRDWWRVSKCFERIKQVNLGGGAIGTGLSIPRYFIMEVVSNLQTLTALPLARSENLSDATSNLDAFVEVHAILKSHAVNLEKMVSDLRLLASDLVNSQAGQWTSGRADKWTSGQVGLRADEFLKPETQNAKPETQNSEPETRQLELPRVQVGSSIMPGKINPVIPEFVISAAHKIYANDQLISGLCAQGCLELNAYLPVIGHALLESLKLLIACDQTLKMNLFDGLAIHPAISREILFRSPAITTALIPLIGYNKASELAKYMKSCGMDIFTANHELQCVEEERLNQLLLPENLLKLGYTLSELEKESR